MMSQEKCDSCLFSFYRGFSCFPFLTEPLRRGGLHAVVRQREQSHRPAETSVGVQPGDTGDSHLPGCRLLCESNFGLLHVANVTSSLERNLCFVYGR